jgi:pimeloyl-ACP methyl ester carboxylesterase
MGATNRHALRLSSGQDADWARGVMEDFDQGTQRAILRLYRSADPSALEAAGADLGRIGAPALVLWGERDPYIPPRFGEELARRLPAGRCEILSGLGHWPWMQDAGVIDRVDRFLGS